MAVIEVPAMPKGYRLTVANGNGWQSFGWVRERVNVESMESGIRGVRVTRSLIAIRNGIGDVERAVAAAWQHSRSESNGP